MLTSWFLQLTEAEDALPAGDVTPPEWQQTAAPLGRYHHSHAVGEHLGDGVDEFLGSGRNFLFQAAEPSLKQYGGDSWVTKTIKHQIKNQSTGFMGMTFAAYLPEKTDTGHWKCQQPGRLLGCRDANV